MIEIKLQQLNDWVQKKFDQKYSQKLQPLKKAFIGFYNLIDQISSLYVAILEHIKKQNKLSQQNDQQFTSLKAIINRSLLIINRMADDQPASIDMLFCDKFIKIFQANLNLLCTYYHSLCHCDILGAKFKYEKKKIVQGINKLYNLHSKIKELFRNNFWDLRNISSHKKFIASNIKLIQAQRQLLLQNQSVFDSFQYEVLGENQFYDGFFESFAKVKHMQEPKRSLMKTYFNILHQFYQAQSQLQVSLQPLINYCQEIKLKKKSSSYGMIDTCNAFLRITTLLLKANYSAKNLKKIKIQDFSKLLTLVTQEYSQHSNNTIEKKKNIEQILQCSIFVIDCVKEMDKVQSSGLLTVINEYKDTVSPPGSKKFIAKLLQYKKYMSYYYQCHESIKAFQRTLQQSMFLQFEEKINLVVTMQSSS